MLSNNVCQFYGLETHINVEFNEYTLSKNNRVYIY